MKSLKIIDVMLLTLVVLLVALMLAPAFARLERTPAEAKCQSNLRQWSHAMAMYCSDNDGRYPINRTVAPSPNYSVQLTPDGLLTADGAPLRFMYGISWVEALYPYIQADAVRSGQDWRSLRGCPCARDMGEKPGGAWLPTSYMTYSLNNNLAGTYRALVRTPGSLMMLRELDRRMNSVVRPTNLSVDSVSSPDTAFLTTSDSYTYPSTTDPNRHGAGSYIAFADGHVRYFTTDYYPKACAWDSDSGKWYNFVYPNPADDTQRRLNKSIAVTP